MVYIIFEFKVEKGKVKIISWLLTYVDIGVIFSKLSLKRKWRIYI